MEGSFLSASIPMRTLCSSPGHRHLTLGEPLPPAAWMGFPGEDPSWIDRDENGNARLTPDRLAQAQDADQPLH